MIPVLSVAEMKAVDEAAPQPIEVLIERAGRAVARHAMEMLGGGYGRRVIVVAGKGNNGADGRVAARHLARRGVRVRVIDASDVPSALPSCDLVIDAAFGTGFRGDYRAPQADARVLAVDIPSGVAGDTGAAVDGAVTADRTVTFAALKPGLLLGEGPARSGEVFVADIGLDTSRASAHVLEPHDVAVPRRPREAHKWHAGVYVVAGSGGMVGAAALAARAALRAGASTLRLAVPGIDPGHLPVGEAVGVALPAEGWEAQVLTDLERFKVLVIGPGLGRTEATQASVRKVVAQSPVPVVADADALVALAEDGVDRADLILTPHEAEFARLSGPIGEDRLADVRAAAGQLGAIVLLKGPTTIVAAPDGRVLMSVGGSTRLATAGTGDVLAGVIGAFVARGIPLQDAAAMAGGAPAGAARLVPETGFLAGDLVDLIPRWLSAR